jgi:hypothetical protein
MGMGAVVTELPERTTKNRIAARGMEVVLTDMGTSPAGMVAMAGLAGIAGRDRRIAIGIEGWGEGWSGAAGPLAERA